MKFKLFGIILLMMLMLVTTVLGAPPQELFADAGYTLEVIAGETHPYNTTYPVHLHLYDTEVGIPIDNVTATCEYHLYDGEDYFTHLDKGTLDYDAPDFEKYIDAGNFTTAGEYSLLVWCEAIDNSKGRFKQIYFDVEEEEINIGALGLWKPVEDWTFPSIYLILVFIILAIAFAYESQMLGVLGSVMLIMAYFVVGATSPILFAPMLIIGFLLAFKFATL